MELAILEYEQVAGPLGDKEAIHTIIYYTKMFRLQSLYNYITTYVILFKIKKKQFRLTFNSLGKVNIMQNIGIIRHNTLRAEYNTTCSRSFYKMTFEYLGLSHEKNVRCNISVNATNVHCSATN